MRKFGLPPETIGSKPARHNLRAARKDALAGSAEDALDAVVESIADDVNRQRFCRTTIEQRSETRVDFNTIQQSIDLIAGCGDEIHLGGEAFPRSNSSGKPRFFDVQPSSISERLENGVSRITPGDRSVEVEEQNRFWF
jgi:hypothetical protein